MSLVAAFILPTSANIFPPCKNIGNSLFSAHDNFILSFQIPPSFDSLEGDQRRPLLTNLISWLNARKWLCSIRGSTLFRTIAVVGWARNLRQHKHDKLCLPRFLTECWNCVIVTAVKIPQVKNTTRGSFTATPTCLARYGRRHITAEPQQTHNHKKDMKWVTKCLLHQKTFSNPIFDYHTQTYVITSTSNNSSEIYNTNVLWRIFLCWESCST